MPFVARGSGTGLSGGALPVSEGVVIVLSRLRGLGPVDADNARIVVEPGVINLWVTRDAAPHDLAYAPDPSSQQVCSIGGNVAENAGGAHCLKYGFTVNHVLGAEVVLPDGSVVNLGGTAPEHPGYDLLGTFIGSKGTLGIATADADDDCDPPSNGRGRSPSPPPGQHQRDPDALQRGWLMRRAAGCPVGRHRPVRGIARARRHHPHSAFFTVASGHVLLASDPARQLHGAKMVTRSPSRAGGPGRTGCRNW